MAKQIFRVDDAAEYRRAGPTDLIELLPVPGCTPLFMVKWHLQALVYGIVSREYMHLSGPTGSGKSSLLDALRLVPQNFAALCQAAGYALRPLKVFPIEMVTYESPGELYQRRALKDGTTYDEPSGLVTALEAAQRWRRKAYVLIWLREMGRVHAASVQGGLLNLMTRGEIVLGDGRRLSGEGIGFVADSNYQAEEDCTHTLVTLDDALKRRFSINLSLGYLLAEQEVLVLEHLLAHEASLRDAA